MSDADTSDATDRPLSASGIGMSEAAAGAASPTPRTDRLQEFLANPTRALWVMAVPMIAGMTVHTMYIVADTAFIGSLGTDELAAATFVAPLFFVMIALTMGIGTAVTALVAQSVGRGDARGADAAAGTAISSGLFLGVLFGGVGLASGRWMLGALGAEGLVAELGWEYFQVLAAFMPLFFVSSVLRSILAGEGDAKTPMIVLAFSTVANIALDALFILVLGMGLPGAAVCDGPGGRDLGDVVFCAVAAPKIGVRPSSYVNFGPVARGACAAVRTGDPNCGEHGSHVGG